MNAAAAFQAAAEQVLRASGVDHPTKGMVAEIVGHRADLWRKYVAGLVSPGAHLPPGWCAAWAAAGHAPITLETTTGNHPGDACGWLATAKLTAR